MSYYGTHHGLNRPLSHSDDCWLGSKNSAMALRREPHYLHISFKTFPFENDVQGRQKGSKFEEKRLGGHKW